MTRPPHGLARAALLLCAAACSAEAPRKEGAAAPAPASAASPTATPVAPVAAARPGDTHARPKPGTLKTFGDWTVGCDNTRRCELRSLAPDLAPPGNVTVSIARDAGPAGALAFRFIGDDGPAPAAAVDGTVQDTPAAIVAAMANGRVLTARADGRTVATISLKGASAALRYADAEQGRAGTVTAAVARGPKPASTVPAAAAAPTIVAIAPAGAPSTPIAAQLAAMRKAARCDTGRDIGTPEAHALGGGRTLVLLPCSAGAYNVIQALFVGDANGFAPARTDAPVGFDATGADSGSPLPTAINGEWKDGALTSYAKGRGLGDCGVTQDLVWDGTQLRLSRQRAMGECRGNAHYITTRRATVRR